jgi:hypothetical protein
MFSVKKLSKDKTHFQLIRLGQVHAVMVRVIEFDGLGFACYWPDIVDIARASQGFRFWQAVWNALSELDQVGLPSPWPDVFFHNGWKPPAEFWAHFEEIDGYLMPRDFDASVGASV